MNFEDGNSSEGIVCSSDDEFDGLSQAVEHHILRQENTSVVPQNTLVKIFQNQFNFNHSHPRKYETSVQRRDQLHLRPQINEANRRYQPDRFPNEQHYQHAVSLSKAHAPADVHSREYGPGMNAGQFSLPMHAHQNSSPKRSVLPPRQDIPRPYLFRNNRVREEGASAFPLSQDHQQAHSSHYMDHNRANEHNAGIFVYDDHLQSHSLPRSRSQSRERVQPMMPNPDLHYENYNMPMTTESRSMEAYEKPHYGKARVPVKPVLFSIKSKPPTQLRHPLDPFTSPLNHSVTEDTSVKRWSHDKYEDEKVKKEVEDIKEGPWIVKREEIKRNEKGRRKRRSRNSTESSPPPIMKIKIDPDKSLVHRKRRKTRGSQRTKSNSSDRFSHFSIKKSPKKEQDSESDRKVTIVKEEVDTDVVYEEEEVLEVDVTLSKSESEDDEELLALRLNALTSALPPNAGDNIKHSDEEDDDELLGLRLDALTSTLDAKKRVNKIAKISGKCLEFEEKKPKHLVRRVVETPKHMSRRRKAKRKSDFTYQFMKQHSVISGKSVKSSTKKKPPAASSRKVAINYNAPQLTLFGEIVKNHHTTKEDALRFIRHHPDEAAKTDLFLNLMKRDQLNVTEVVDLHKQNLNQNKAKHKQVEAASTTKPQEMGYNKTNYDEIEMDLGDGDSDSDLVPPGTDSSLIKPPSLESSEVSTHQQDSNSNANGIDKQSPTTVPATPTQESIWSMLEISTLLAPREPDADSTVTNEKEQADSMLGMPSQESMWSMLEHESVLNPTSVSVKEDMATSSKNKNAETKEKRGRIPSEENVDESLLREILLKQMDKKQQPKEQTPVPDSTVSSTSEKMDVVEKLEQQVDLLPSQYPYQPPTLSLQTTSSKKINSVTTGTKKTTSTVTVKKENPPPLRRPNTRSSAALKASAALVTPSLDDMIVRPVPPLHIVNPSAFISGIGNVAVNSPSSLSEVTKAAIAMSSINMTSSHFNPPMASTPTLLPISKPDKATVSSFKTAKKARKRRRNKAKQASKKALLKNISDATQNQKTDMGVLKPTELNITNTPKSHTSDTARLKSKKSFNQPTAESNVQNSTSSKTTQALIAASKKESSNLDKGESMEPVLQTSQKPASKLATIESTKTVTQPSQISSGVLKKQSLITVKPISTDASTQPPSTSTTVQAGKSIVRTAVIKIAKLAESTESSTILTRSQNPAPKSLPKGAVAPASSSQPSKIESSELNPLSKSMPKTVANSASSSQSPKPNTDLTVMPKNPLPKKLISPGPKVSNQASKTVYKSATTIIKSTRIPSKRPAESSSPDPAKRKAIPANENKPVHLLLPRHQPVVVNIGGSSDEDDTVVSPTRRRTTAQNPLDLHKNMLEAMIKQAREQTSVKPKTKDESKTKIQTNVQESMSPGSVTSQKSPPPSKTQSQLKNHSNIVDKKNTSVRPQTPSEIKSITRQQKQSSTGEHQKGSTVLHLRQTREKFLKLKTLIGKDEIKYVRLMNIKESKRSELKVVEDELKEMLHRVAAIKGKAARCEGLLKRYEQHEIKIKTRLEKRKGLKLKLKERIKRQMLKARSEQREKEKETVTSYAHAGSNQKTSVNVSPAKLSQDELDLEKQRLLAIEQQLAAEIDKMKKSDVNAAAIGSRRVSLSREVQSHLAKYKEMKKANNPTAHDLSLSKIAISALSPARNLQTLKAAGTLSPARRLLQSPASSRGSSPVAPRIDPKATVETNPSKETIKSSSVEEKLGGVSEVELGKLRKFLQHNFTNLKSLFLECDRPFTDCSHSAKSWHKKTPDFFKTWKVDVGELIIQSNREDAFERKTYKFQSYESPLRTFRSYRLSPFLRMKEKLMIKSRTFSHKINPEQILCKYDLTGTCQDPDCKGQHLKQYELTPSELLLDLLSYCPELLGKELSKDLEYKDLIKLADTACDKLCGTSSSQTNTMSIDEKCILVTSKINTALGNKAPFTTIMRPRRINVLQERNKMSWKTYLQQDLDADNEVDISNGATISLNLEKKQEHPDSFIKDDERYFIERHPGSLHIIEEAVEQNPHNIQLWLELTYKKMHKPTDGRQNSLEIGLHTLSLALEENPYVGELWGHYLGLLRKHKGSGSEQDRDEMVSQALELVPLSSHVWKQLLSWDYDIIKREFLYDQLISNLIRNVEGHEIMDQMSLDVASRWLLQTVLQKVQLQLFSHPIAEVLSFLEMTVKNFSQQCRSVSLNAGNSSRRCLTPKDLSALWLCYISVKYFNALPQCFLPSTSGSNINVKSCLGVVVSPGFEVKLCFNSKNTLDTILYCDLCADLKVAINECAANKETECIECIDLFREKLRLEIFQQYWNTAVGTCDIIWTKLSKVLQEKNFSEYVTEDDVNKILTDVAITWADVLVKKGDPTEATKVFENAVIQNPSNARICYEAALFQLNQESTDVDEVLLYFESCATAYLHIEKDTLTTAELKNLFQFLLRLPISLTFKSPNFISEELQESAKESKSYFWMIYILLLEISGGTPSIIMDNYESSIIDVENEIDRQQIWLKYLLFRQSNAPVATEPAVFVSKLRQAWLRNFTAAVRRCISTCSSDLKTDNILNCDACFSDYSFHNQIASIYLSCFHTRQQLSTAYVFLTELMPYNIPLLLRACGHFLNFGDYSTIMSILWKITATASCQDKTIWKISTAAHFSRGRIAKAIHLCRRSVEAMQYSRELWTDYLTLLRAFANPSDFAAEKDRCSSVLQCDATRLLPEGFLQHDKQGV